MGYTPINSILYAVAGLLILFGIIGNSMIIIAVKKKRFLRSTTNYLLVNLAVSDLTSLIFLPLMTIESHVTFKEGILADFLCKFVITWHVPLTASTVSILTILVLAIERYYAIVKPMRAGHRLTEDNVHFAITAVWVTGIIVTVPYYIFGSYDGRNDKCNHSNLSSQAKFIYAIIFQVTFTFLPFIITTFCYFQIVRDTYFKNSVMPQNIAAIQEVLSRRKIVKLSLSITTAFAFCFIPLSITLILTAVDNKRFGKKYYRYASVLYFCQSVLNPLLYGLQSTNFRRAFKEMFRLN